jgi:hypothetical protein
MSTNNASGLSLCRRASKLEGTNLGTLHFLPVSVSQSGLNW